MTKKELIIGLVGVLLGAVLLGGVSLYLGGTDEVVLPPLGATHFNSDMVLRGTLSVSGATTHTGTLTIGSSGAALTQALSGNCTGVQPEADIAATSTQQWYCAISNVAANDRVFVQLDAPAVTSGNLSAIGARATTTGAIGIDVLNLTGTATTSPSATYRKVNYWIVR